MHFRLADNGDYELTNLNRQHTFIDQIGVNKAEFHKNELLRINPYIDVEFFREGVSKQNLPDLVQWADFIVDGVDVTTESAIQLKFLLHKLAHDKSKAVVSPLDPGYCQMGYTFDYRNPSVRPLRGRLEKCLAAKGPIPALMAMFPLRTWPNHSLQLIIDLLENGNRPASQLACSADVLAGIAAALVIRFVSTGELASDWRIELASTALSTKERFSLWLNSFSRRARIKKLLRTRASAK